MLRQALAQHFGSRYIGCMPRSGAPARQRLQQAALELFIDRGFESTTTADIASRAGVNDRTFFRHFADKREVLFGGQDELRESLVQVVRAQPTTTAPLDALRQAFLDSAHVLEANKAFGVRRLQVIARTPALRERDLAKGSAMALALADALHDRGVERSDADLAGMVGWATFHHAAWQWIAAPDDELREYITTAFDRLAALSDSGSDGVGEDRLHETLGVGSGANRGDRSVVEIGEVEVAVGSHPRV